MLGAKILEISQPHESYLIEFGELIMTLFFPHVLIIDQSLIDKSYPSL